MTSSVPPSVAREPFHEGSSALEAVQLVAFELAQVSWLVPPSGIAVGTAESDAVTAGPTVTVAVAGALVAPPAPLQVSVYVASTVGVTVTVPPSIARAPFQAGSCALEAVQLVAFELPQVSSLEPPSAIAVGVAERAAVTAGPTVTVAFAAGLVAPPAPVHVTEYAVVVVGETSTLPLGASPVEKPTP